jgi:hypothetical protein
MTPEQHAIFESLLIRLSKEFAARLIEHKLPALSLHIAPDMSYISNEHESLPNGFIARKSPACIEVLVKL